MLELMGRHSGELQTWQWSWPFPAHSRFHVSIIIFFSDELQPQSQNSFQKQFSGQPWSIDYSPLAWHPSRLRANAHNSTTLTTQEKRSWQHHSSSRLTASQQSGPWHLALRAATESKGSAHSQARTNSLSSHNLGGKNRTWRSPVIENKENFSKDSCLPFRGIYWVSAVVKKELSMNSPTNHTLMTILLNTTLQNERWVNI